MSHVPRCPAHGQTYGVDYEKAFAPVAKMTTVQTVIALTVARGWHLHKMDVKNVFFQGELEEEVFMINHLVLNRPTIRK